MPEENAYQTNLNLLPELSHLRDLLGNGFTLFTGVGNVLRTDDGVGVYIASNIQKNRNIHVINVEVSIENYVGCINSIGADKIIIIDCVHYGREPGYCRLLPVEDLRDQTTHTHNISLQKISMFFTAPVWILGVQPASVAFGDVMSPSVLKAAEQIIQFINSLLVKG